MTVEASFVATVYVRLQGSPMHKNLKTAMEVIIFFQALVKKKIFSTTSQSLSNHMKKYRGVKWIFMMVETTLSNCYFLTVRKWCVLFWCSETSYIALKRRLRPTPCHSVTGSQTGGETSDRHLAPYYKERDDVARGGKTNCDSLYARYMKNICRRFRGSSELKFQHLDEFFIIFLEMGEMYRKIFGDTSCRMW